MFKRSIKNFPSELNFDGTIDFLTKSTQNFSVGPNRRMELCEKVLDLYRANNPICLHEMFNGKYTKVFFDLELKQVIGSYDPTEEMTKKELPAPQDRDKFTASVIRNRSVKFRQELFDKYFDHESTFTHEDLHNTIRFIQMVLYNVYHANPTSNKPLNLNYVLTRSTKSTISYHLIFPYIYIPTKGLSNLQDLIKNMQLVDCINRGSIGGEPSPLKRYDIIDLAPYRSGASLRFPYTLKDNPIPVQDSRDFHMFCKWDLKEKRFVDYPKEKVTKEVLYQCYLSWEGVPAYAQKLYLEGITDMSVARRFLGTRKQMETFALHDMAYFPTPIYGEPDTDFIPSDFVYYEDSRPIIIHSKSLVEKARETGEDIDTQHPKMTLSENLSKPQVTKNTPTSRFTPIDETIATLVISNEDITLNSQQARKMYTPIEVPATSPSNTTPGPIDVESVSSVFYNDDFDQKFSLINKYIQNLTKNTGFRWLEAPSLEIHSVANFEFISEYTKCPLCNRSKVHKNHWQVKFFPTLLRVYKLGNATACNTFQADLNELKFDVQDLNQVVKLWTKEHVVSYEGEYYFSVGRKWLAVDNNKELAIYSVLDKAPYQKNVKGLMNIEKRLIDLIKITNPRQPTGLQGPEYIMPFLNKGINITSKATIEPQKYFTPSYINHCYHGVAELATTQQLPSSVANGYIKAKTILHKIIDSIMPMDNPYRNLFEYVMAQTLEFKHKGKIDIFLGPTSTGKSTIRAMFERLFDTQYTGMSASTLLSGHKTSATANPDLAKIGGKRVVFGSELDKNEVVKSQTIKYITEKSVNARQLYSSKTNHSNKASMLIDTNFPLAFDGSDTALVKRIRTIQFNSFFVLPDDWGRKEELAKGRKIEMADTSVSDFIASECFPELFLDLLLEWYGKHSSPPDVKVDDTDEVYRYRKALRYIFQDGTVGTDVDGHESTYENEEDLRHPISKIEFITLLESGNYGFNIETAWAIYTTLPECWLDIGTVEAWLSSNTHKIQSICKNIVRDMYHTHEDSDVLLGESAKEYARRQKFTRLYQMADPEIESFNTWISGATNLFIEHNVDMIIDTMDVNRISFQQLSVKFKSHQPIGHPDD